MKEKEWYPIAGYEGLYEINKHGILRSLHKRNYHKELSARIDRAGYLTVRLNVKGKCITQYVHRLLGLTFIPNKENKSLINHINGNKLDNRLSNLEWVDHSENVTHAYKNGLIKVSSLSVRKVIDSCTGKVFASIKEAASYFSLNYSTCRHMLSGTNKNTTCLQYAA
jgi:hypothetical protein